MTTSNTTATPDAPTTSWVDRLPTAAQPYLRLMRADRPIGTWLLLIPCWWGLALAWVHDPASLPLPTAMWFALLFSIGAFVMRGAGCVYNDIVDRDFDAQVTRTATRPIPAGLVSVRNAWIFLIGLSLIGLAVLIQFNHATIITGLGALALVAAYPFMKRITWWPQAWLGLTFNWGALVGWAAVTGSLGASAVLIYVAGIFWTLGYDTIYAHQDKEDDALIGVRSTARALDADTKTWLLVFYTGTIFFAALAGLFAGVSGLFYIALMVPAAHFLFQIAVLKKDDTHNCLILFKANRDTGLMLLLAILFGGYSL